MSDFASDAGTRPAPVDRSTARHDDDVHEQDSQARPPRTGGARVARVLVTLALLGGIAAAGTALAADDVPLEDILVERAANTLLGSSIGALPVVTPDGQALGDVSDVILSDNGRVVALVVGVGGFLSLAEKPVAIRWGQLSVRPAEGDGFEIVCALDRDALDAAPRYRERDD